MSEASSAAAGGRVMASDCLLAVGSYTSTGSAGITVFEATGDAWPPTELCRVDSVVHPSFVVAAPGGRVWYAVSETAPGEVVSLRLDLDDGSLTVADRASSGGDAPCHLSVDPSGDFLLVANYGSGTIASIPVTTEGRFDGPADVHQHTGRGPTSRQEGPHAHCIVAEPNDDRVAAADLGTDRVHRYRRVRGALRPDGDVEFAPGTGPRHLVVHPFRSLAVVLGELSSTLEVFDIDERDASFRHVQSVPTLPHGFDGESIGAEVRIHPGGRFVYASNRGHDSIAVFRLADDTSELELVGHVASGGRTPRNFAVHPTGRTMVVANQDSGSLVRFDIDPGTGQPSRADEPTVAVDAPVCVTFVEVEA